MKDLFGVEHAAEKKFGPKDLASLWNELKSPIQPKLNLSTFTSKKPRYLSAKRRLEEAPDRGHWELAIRRIAASPFCNGRNDRRWVASFTFLIRPETADKALEGEYDQGKGSGKLRRETPILSMKD